MTGQCGVEGCGNRLDADDDLGVCGSCGVRIARRYRLRILSEEREASDRHEAARKAAAVERQRRETVPDMFAEHRQPAGSSFVYYVQIHDHIKIGYSSNVVERLRALRVPKENLLALEPGGRAREHEIHQRFEHLRITHRWENFRPAPDLLAYIAALDAEHGLPAWLSAPRPGKNGPVRVRRRAQ